MTVIYQITSPTGKVYIGQSRNFKLRISLYSKLHCKKQILLYNSLKKHGFAKHKVETLFSTENEISQGKLNDTEVFFWSKAILSGCVMLNVRMPGNGRLTDEIRRKISVSNKGKGGRLSFLGRKHTAAHKQHISIINKGKVFSVETRSRLSISHKFSGIRAVNQYDLQGNFIKGWVSIKEAGTNLAISRGNISRCANGYLGRTGKFKWQFKTTE